MNLLPADTDRGRTWYDFDAVREVSRLNGRPMALEGKYLWREGKMWRTRRPVSLWTRFSRYMQERGYPVFGFPGLYGVMSEHLCPRWITWIWTVLLLAIQAAAYLRLCHVLFWRLA